LQLHNVGLIGCVLLSIQASPNCRQDSRKIAQWGTPTPKHNCQPSSSIVQLQLHRATLKDQWTPMHRASSNCRLHDGSNVQDVQLLAEGNMCCVVLCARVHQPTSATTEQPQTTIAFYRNSGALKPKVICTFSSRHRLYPLLRA
jgi:hypothetical protein